MMMVRLIKSQEGILSIGVPGTVYGMWEVHKIWQSAMENISKPAIRLAEEGFIMSPFMVDALNKDIKK